MFINAKDFGLKEKVNIRIQERFKSIKLRKKADTLFIYLKGTYYIRKALVIYDSTTLLLEEGATLLRKGKDALLKMVDA